MDLDNFIKMPKVGEIVKGKVIGKGRASVFLDLGNAGVGMIYGKEFYDSKNRLKNISLGEEVFVKVIDIENEDGYIELSLTEANKDLAWEILREKKEKDETIIVKILNANKGGLLTEISGIPAFLPVSQLSSQNYPKIEDGDSQKILKSIQKFIGQEMEVKIFDLDPKEGKLILSERAKEDKKLKEIIKNFKVGDIVEGEITGIVDFGAFIKITSPSFKTEEGEDIIIEGLIHISELDWQLVEDPSDIVKVGQKVKAKIVDIVDGRISLSLKALYKDPWENIEEKYKKNDIIKGKVTKLNPFGAFVQLLSDDSEKETKIQGLCHISEFGSQKKMEEMLKIGRKYNFQILSIEPKEHRMSLKLVE
jgi:small subunit ribosomal protein S1